MRGKLFVVIGLVIIVALLAGCAGIPGLAPQKTTLRVVVYAYDNQVKADWDKIVADFKKVEPNIEVKIEMPPINDVYTQFVADIKAGNPPDIINQPSAQIAEFADGDVLYDWNEYLPDVAKALKPQMLEEGTYKGKLYGMPYLSTSRGLYVNTAMFDAAGVKPPKTWDEFVQVAQKLQKPPDQFALALQGKGAESFAAWFPYFLWSFGGELYDNDCKPAFDSPEGLKALQFMNDLVNKYKVTQPDVVATDLSEQMGLFKAGKAAMTITGPWMIPIMQGEAPNIKYDVVPIPTGTKQVTLGVADVYLLLKGKNTHPKEAAKFMAFVMNPQNHLMFVKGRGMLPTLAESFKDPYFSSIPQLKTHLDMLDQVKWRPKCATWNKTQEVGDKELQAMYLGQKAPQDVLKTIAATAKGQ
jgi:multiple sugar transport system substrate-binding protein